MKPAKNNNLLKLLAALCLQAVVMVPQALALPTLQAYLTGSTGTASGSVSTSNFSLDDADSWHLKTPAGELVGLTLQGVYSPTGVTKIDNGFLVITVPDQQDLSMFFDLPNKGLVDNLTLQQFYYDDNSAFESYLASNFTLTGTPPVQLNNHSPLGADPALVDVYAIPLDWLQSGFGTFGKLSTAQLQALYGQQLQDCNATDNTCTPINNKPGDLRLMNVGFNDVSWAHIDLVAKVTTKTKVNGCWVTESHFEINPPSHDSTWQIPEPGTLALTAIGLAGLLARRRLV